MKKSGVIFANYVPICYTNKHIKISNDSEYYKSHKVCPKCKEIPSLMTYMGTINPGDENHDINSVWCKCGWIGEVHKLVGINL